MKNVNNFQKWQMFSLKVLLSICLNFFQFQPSVAYKSVAYKKIVYFNATSLNEALKALNNVLILQHSKEEKEKRIKTALRKRI